MPDDVKLAKAELKELDEQFANPKNSDKWVTVQFNPDTLKVTYANQIQQPSGGGDQRGPQAQQFVGAGSMKLAVQLYFDVTQALPDKDSAIVDVRKLTQRVAYYITPAPKQGSNTQFIPPAIRFLWGSFQFDGIMESLEETLEYFSPDGRPLRATLAIVLTQQKITTFKIANLNAPKFTRKNRSPVGTTPQTEAPANSNVQSLAGDGNGGDSSGDNNSSGGAGADWQTIAAANGIENPRMLEPGQLIDLSLRKPQIALE
jgi:contractile injection system tube protein